MDATIDLNDFHLVEPRITGAQALAFSVMTDGTLRINGKLQSKIKQNGLYIRINSRMDVILLEEACRDEENAHALAKNGYVKVPEIVEGFAKVAMKAPARYRVAWNEQIGMWIGTYDGHHVFPAISKDADHKDSKRIRTRRKSNLKEMLPPEGK